LQNSKRFLYNFGGGIILSLKHAPPLKNTSVALATLGCKLNQAETESFGRLLAQVGCQIVSKDQKADIYLINTCSVTHVADRKSRQLLRAVHRLNPDACVVALGCSADNDRAAISRIKGVDLILDNSAKKNLVSSLRLEGLLPVEIHPYKPEPGQRTRSLVKAQYGCSLFCAYCIVPNLRGPEKSISPDEVVSEINQRVVEGYREVVLTGTELGRYSCQGLSLSGLVGEILTSTSIPRLRISSLQPQEIDHELLQLWQNPRLCRHFHLSLQSGSDSVLARMRRRYSCQEYKGTIMQIKSQVPGTAITTDIIVGFPGETDQEFQDSHDFCRELNFSRIHVFSFSARTGTQAAKMTGQISPEIIYQRSQKMLALSLQGQAAFAESLLGSVLPVLFESGIRGVWRGLTDNYVRVYADSTQELNNRVARVALKRLFGDGLEGEILDV
jgi:threonylcarbamoyladenosine tRNA methylthiotransferase MtaB